MTKEQKVLDEAVDVLEIMLARIKSEDWHNTIAKRSVMDGVKLSIGKLKRLKDGKRQT
jgi:hypothetical protein